MWPILVVSLVDLTVVIERVAFFIREKRSRCPETAEKMFSEDEKGTMEEARHGIEDATTYLKLLLLLQDKGL